MSSSSSSAISLASSRSCASLSLRSSADSRFFMRNVDSIEPLNNEKWWSTNLVLVQVPVNVIDLLIQWFLSICIPDCKTWAGTSWPWPSCCEGQDRTRCARGRRAAALACSKCPCSPWTASSPYRDSASPRSRRRGSPKKWLGMGIHSIFWMLLIIINLC